MTKIITNVHNPMCKYFNMYNNKTEIKEIDLTTGFLTLACGCVLPINDVFIKKGII